MFNPNHPSYAKSLSGQPEFSSILLTIDSKMQRPQDHHVVQKFVVSTQSLMESLTSLFDYYAEHGIMHQARTIELIRESGKAADPVFVYVTPENIQVIASCETWNGLVMHAGFGNGSVLLASEKLTEVVAHAIADQQKQFGDKFAPLFFFDVTVPSQAELDQQPEEGKDPAPGVAEQMVEQSDIQRV